MGLAVARTAALRNRILVSASWARAPRSGYAVHSDSESLNTESAQNSVNLLASPLGRSPRTEQAMASESHTRPRHRTERVLESKFVPYIVRSGRRRRPERAPGSTRLRIAVLDICLPGDIRRSERPTSPVRTRRLERVICAHSPAQIAGCVSTPDRRGRAPAPWRTLVGGACAPRARACVPGDALRERESRAEGGSQERPTAAGGERQGIIRARASPGTE